MTTSSDQRPTTKECPLAFDMLPYNGAEVQMEDCTTNGTDNEEFLDKLRLSIEYWKSNDFMSAWVHVPMSRASLIEQLTKSNKNNNNNDSKNDNDFAFDLHHVNTKTQTIVIKKWLKDGAPDKIPPFATHQVGCAGFVLNDRNEILVIREWRSGASPSARRIPTKQWKLPGGLLDAGESFGEAACREVEEETGIRCEFESILTFWHRHGLVFGKSDMYFVCLLRPTSSEIRIDPVEVSAAQWISIDDFVRTQDHPLILHVLRNAFGVDANNSKNSVGNSKRLVPRAELTEGSVRWPNRPPIPTYMPQSNDE